MGKHKCNACGGSKRVRREYIESDGKGGTKKVVRYERCPYC